MTTLERAGDLDFSPAAKWRQYVVVCGRIGLAALLVLAWQFGADTAGELYFPQPMDVVRRLAEDTLSGTLLWHTYVTLRLSVIGFLLGCAAGILLPFLMRRSPRVTNAVEPYIMASVGVPKYALIPLFILWFGIDDAPKLWLVGLLVFYVVFIAIFAGIRNVDFRLVTMARVVGASESMISRRVIWKSLTPFFFAALKIALPRAVSAAIIGEFLVGNAGLGFLIEDSRQQVDSVGVFTGIIVATALVLVINAILERTDRYVNAWRPVDRHMQL